jgi:TetR/AcrR family transcriptional regulator, transcriptional repressor for nem operon
MARKKEFDPKQALAKAMSVFWRLGFENTSIDVLMREMGIAKQSLYDTFGNKRELYLKALAYYRDETNAGLRQVFESDRSVRDGFAELLFGLSSESPEQHERDCLLLSANLERDTGDAVIANFYGRIKRPSNRFLSSKIPQPRAASPWLQFQGCELWPGSSPSEKLLNKLRKSL